MHNEELPDIIGGDKMKEDGMARMKGGGERNAHGVRVGKPKRK